MKQARQIMKPSSEDPIEQYPLIALFSELRQLLLYSHAVGYFTKVIVHGKTGLNHKVEPDRLHALQGQIHGMKTALMWSQLTLWDNGMVVH